MILGCFYAEVEGTEARLAYCVDPYNIHITSRLVRQDWHLKSNPDLLQHMLIFYHWAMGAVLHSIMTLQWDTQEASS